MRVLITGASGFVGKAVTAEFINNNLNVSTVGREDFFKSQNIDFFKISDLRQHIDWSPMLDGIDVVVHLAAHVHQMNEVDQNLHFSINHEATVRLAKAAERAGVKRFVYLSTIKVNGENTQNCQKFYADDVFCNTEDPYALSKYMAEADLKKICHQSSMQYVIIRPPLIYGPGVKGNLLNFIKILKKRIPLPFGSINNSRSLVSLENISNFIYVCAVHRLAANQIFLVSDGRDVSTKEMVTSIRYYLNIPPLLIPMPKNILNFFFFICGRRNYGQRLLDNLQIDIKKNRDLLNWEPVYKPDGLFKSTLSINCDKM